jgi:hypothetical protein
MTGVAYTIQITRLECILDTAISCESAIQENRNAQRHVLVMLHRSNPYWGLATHVLPTSNDHKTS